MIRFQVECHTQWGQSVAVCGSGALGDWDPACCLLLEPAAYPVWTGEISVPPTTIEYKYVLVETTRPTGVPALVAWENAGSNRRVELGTCRRLVLNERFGRLECPGTPPRAAAPRLAANCQPPYFSAEELAGRLGDDDIQVIDVRDNDFVGGHIRGARHYPSEDFEPWIKVLAEEFAKSRTILVFHCMYSRVRGPRCASMLRKHLADYFPDWRCSVFVLAGGYDRWRVLFGGDPRADVYIADRLTPALEYPSQT
mmetsp:Transcript_5193/g.15277  ORF Transcript_5193/g.15277 Transcript_5193/m.15277 type:complete len:254 (-) Transcript_5193:281-1042(-)